MFYVRIAKPSNNQREKITQIDTGMINWLERFWNVTHIERCMSRRRQCLIEIRFWILTQMPPS